jgi:hypothetical protein
MLSNSYVTIGAVDYRSPAIYCNDWLDLLGLVKAGENRRVPQQTGRAVRPRYPDEVRAGLSWRINGRWNTDGTAYTGLSVPHAYLLWADLFTVAQVNTPQTASVTIEGVEMFTTSLIVEALDPPQPLNGTPDILMMLMDVTLSDGPVTLAGS